MSFDPEKVVNSLIKASFTNGTVQTVVAMRKTLKALRPNYTEEQALHLLDVLDKTLAMVEENPEKLVEAYKNGLMKD